MVSCEELVEGWIEYSGCTCPCVGEWCEVVYNDGDVSTGIGQEHWFWGYVDRYRLIAPPAP